MEARFRRGVPADRGGIEALFLEMLRTIYHTDRVSGYGEHELDRFFSGGEDWICVAEEAGSVVAYLSMEVHREGPDFVYLDDMSVTEAYRGQGIGSRLLAIAEQFARQLRIPLLVLHAERDNAAARRLYERLGYTLRGAEGSRVRMIKDLEESTPMDYVKSIRGKLGPQKILLNCAGAVIERDGKVLLQRRSDNGQWGLPGGILELEETYAQAALREVREETGLLCELTALLGIYHNYDMMWPNGDRAHTIGALYTARIVGGALRTDEESLELRFFSREELPPLCFEDHRAALADYFRGVRLPLPAENLPERKERCP